MISRYMAAVALLLIAAGCDPKVTDPPPALGTMRAQVTGAVGVNLEWNATFGTGTHSSTWYQRYVEGSESPGATRHLLLQILGVHNPAPGTYPLQPRFFQGGDSTGNTAIFWYGGDFYIAESGTLTITYAPDRWFAADSDEHVDGNFDFTAVYWCTGACYTLPDTFRADLPRIHVTGEFSAIPPPPVPPL